MKSSEDKKQEKSIDYQLVDAKNAVFSLDLNKYLRAVDQPTGDYFSSLSLENGNILFHIRHDKGVSHYRSSLIWVGKDPDNYPHFKILKELEYSAENLRMFRKNSWIISEIPGKGVLIGYHDHAKLYDFQGADLNTQFAYPTDSELTEFADKNNTFKDRQNLNLHGVRFNLTVHSTNTDECKLELYACNNSGGEGGYKRFLCKKIHIMEILECVLTKKEGKPKDAKIKKLALDKLLVKLGATELPAANRYSMPPLTEPHLVSEIDTDNYKVKYQSVGENSRLRPPFQALLIERFIKDEKGASQNKRISLKVDKGAPGKFGDIIKWDQNNFVFASCRANKNPVEKNVKSYVSVEWVDTRLLPHENLKPNQGSQAYSAAITHRADIPLPFELVKSDSQGLFYKHNYAMPNISISRFDDYIVINYIKIKDSADKKSLSVLEAEDPSKAHSSFFSIYIKKDSSWYIEAYPMAVAAEMMGFMRLCSGFPFPVFKPISDEHLLVAYDNTLSIYSPSLNQQLRLFVTADVRGALSDIRIDNDSAGIIASYVGQDIRVDDVSSLFKRVQAREEASKKAVTGAKISEIKSEVTDVKRDSANKLFASKVGTQRRSAKRKATGDVDLAPPKKMSDEASVTDDAEKDEPKLKSVETKKHKK